MIYFIKRAEKKKQPIHARRSERRIDRGPSSVPMFTDAGHADKRRAQRTKFRRVQRTFHIAGERPARRDFKFPLADNRSPSRGHFSNGSERKRFGARALDLRRPRPTATGRPQLFGLKRCALHYHARGKSKLVSADHRDHERPSVVRRMKNPVPRRYYC